MEARRAAIAARLAANAAAQGQPAAVAPVALDEKPRPAGYLRDPRLDNDNINGRFIY